MGLRERPGRWVDAVDYNVEPATHIGEGVGVVDRDGVGEYSRREWAARDLRERPGRLVDAVGRNVIAIFVRHICEGVGGVDRDG